MFEKKIIEYLDILNYEYPTHKKIEARKKIIKIIGTLKDENKFIHTELDKQQEIINNYAKELDSLKEIEQLHQEENGKLRVELEQEKEKNKALEEIENKLMPLAECSYWDYEKHTCTHTCRGCDELSSDNRRSHSGILIDKDRYCRLYEDGYAEEDTRYVNVSDLIKRHCKLEEK